jgi:hypothetical protein
MTISLNARKAPPLARFIASIVAGAALLLLTPATTTAQCSGDMQLKHFRGGIWKQWILQITPGPKAIEAIKAIVDEVNQARTQGSCCVKPIEYVGDKLLVSVFQEHDARGPNGEPLPEADENGEAYPSDNLESFIGVFVKVPDAGAGGGVLFLTALRTNGALTALTKDIPGAPAEAISEIKMSWRSVATNWILKVITPGPQENTRIEFAATYPPRIMARGQVPAAGDYLNCNLAAPRPIVYRSLPSSTFVLLDRYQLGAVALPNSEVTVNMKVESPDPSIQAIFSDRENRQVALIELERIARFVRLQPR